MFNFKLKKMEENKKNDEIDLKLKRFVENIERLEEDKKEISRQISEVYSEAKGFGFNSKAIREIVKIRKTDTEKRIELEQLLEVYKEALGML